jgi:hypothetical protein
MDFPHRSRIALILGGGAAALAAGVIGAWVLTGGHRNEKLPPPPASRGGLVIDPTAQPDAKVAPSKALRCFVAGQFVGEFTLAECAQRNGVATDALDVGVDQTGALAAAQQGGAVVTPLPPRETKPAPAPEPQATAAPSGACWRYDGSWRKLADMTLAACTQTLFAGRCEKPGQALYGRWGQQTLRLVPGKVEISGDNRSFHTLVEQTQGCSVAAAG